MDYLLVEDDDMTVSATHGNEPWKTEAIPHSRWVSYAVMSLPKEL